MVTILINFVEIGPNLAQKNPVGITLLFNRPIYGKIYILSDIASGDIIDVLEF